MNELIIGYCTAEQLADIPELMGRYVIARLKNDPTFVFNDPPHVARAGYVTVYQDVTIEGNWTSSTRRVPGATVVELFSVFDQHGKWLPMRTVYEDIRLYSHGLLIPPVIEVDSNDPRIAWLLKHVAIFDLPSDNPNDPPVSGGDNPDAI